MALDRRCASNLLSKIFGINSDTRQFLPQHTTRPAATRVARSLLFLDLFFRSRLIK